MISAHGRGVQQRRLRDVAVVRRVSTLDLAERLGVVLTRVKPPVKTCPPSESKCPPSYPHTKAQEGEHIAKGDGLERAPVVALRAFADLRRREIDDHRLEAARARVVPHQYVLTRQLEVAMDHARSVHPLQAGSEGCGDIGLWGRGACGWVFGEGGGG